MFERFDDAARHAVVDAQRHATELHAVEIGSEHLLLGILTDEYVAGLAELGFPIDLSVVREFARKDPANRQPEQLPFAEETRKALELALREALGAGASRINSDHLLLALLRRPCTALAVLTAAHVDVAALTAAVRDRSGAPVDERAGGFAAAVAGRRSRTAKGVGVLAQFGVNLTEAAREGKLDTVIGRDSEIERCVQILGRRTKANPVLVGEAGVGKTAVAEGIASRIAAGTVPETLEGVAVWSVDFSSMLAGTRLRGDFEERVRAVIQAARDPKVVLFVDEIHAALGLGTSSEGGGVSASGLLKPALARGDLRLIGATTHDEYRQIVRDKALERRLTPVTIDAPSAELCRAMLTGLRERYETHHALIVDDDALDACVALTDRYVPERNQPDKAIDALDETLAYVRIHAQPPESTVRDDREALVTWAQRRRNQQSDTAADEGAAAIQGRLDGDGVAWHIRAVDVARTVATMSGVPTDGRYELVDDERDRLIRLDALLGERVKGQPDAIATVSRALRRVRAGLGDAKRVGGAFLFVGPTGVGKTELARTLASVMFGRDDALIQIDMSEYMEAHAVSRLIGAPPGYVGHGEGGQLTEAVRRRPWSVVLFDEIEKAHPDVTNVLLQLLEEGRVTDAQGRKVDFSNTIVIATSNLGTEQLGRNHIGFGQADRRDDSATLTAAVKAALRPELLGRFDDVVVFNSLGPVEIAQITETMVADIASRLVDDDVTVELTPAALAQIAAAGWDPQLGARPLRRCIQRLVEDRLANARLAGELVRGSVAVLDAGDDTLTLTVRPAETPVECELVGA